MTLHVIMSDLLRVHYSYSPTYSLASRQRAHAFSYPHELFIIDLCTPLSVVQGV